MRLYWVKTMYECGEFSLCKKPGLIAECRMLQDTQFLFTLKRGSAVLKTRMLQVSRFSLQIFSVLCKDARPDSSLG